MLTVGGLFSGIGGWELGLERAGMRILWHCESDEFCQRVLKRHWPAAPLYPDVRTLRRCDVEPVDVLCGGFPCQDISVAGRGAGITGARSSLWTQMLRLTDELRPRYLLVENVAALVTRGLDVVLADLAQIGFDAEWDCLRASDFGAPHRRERIWIVAYPSSPRRRQDPRGASGDETAHEGWPKADHHVADGDGEGNGTWHMADTDGTRPTHMEEGAARTAIHRGGLVVDPAAGGRGVAGWPSAEWWAVEPDVGRVAHGIPHRVDRLRSLGNALVPQISEWIGRRILEWEMS